MTKYDDAGWVKTYEVQLAIADTFTILILRGPHDEIIEVPVELLLHANHMYLTRWQMLKAKVSWIWKIIKV